MCGYEIFYSNSEMLFSICVRPKHKKHTSRHTVLVHLAQASMSTERPQKASQPVDLMDLMVPDLENLADLVEMMDPEALVDPLNPLAEPLNLLLNLLVDPAELDRELDPVVLQDMAEDQEQIQLPVDLVGLLDTEEARLVDLQVELLNPLHLVELAVTEII